MDFKVTGTAKGITACQMDIKVDGLSYEILTQALDQAKQGRLHILGEMAKAIEYSRSQLSDYAPKMTSFKINPNKIKNKYFIESPRNSFFSSFELNLCKRRIRIKVEIFISPK